MGLAGMAFCGCERSIHAVTGVTWGQRLVLLVWTRPPTAVAPKEHACYFRRGSGQSIWLTALELREAEQATEHDTPLLGLEKALWDTSLGEALPV